MSDMKGFSTHDHSVCISEALEAAREKSEREGLRLTPARLQVLEILLREHRAMGAYEILDHLRAAGKPSQPPVAYRALDFLTEHGFAHKIESLNAYVACTHPENSHWPAFMICSSCKKVAETQSNAHQLSKAAEQSGFEIHTRVIEAEGLCQDCRGDDA